MLEAEASDSAKAIDVEPLLVAEHGPQAPIPEGWVCLDEPPDPLSHQLVHHGRLLWGRLLPTSSLDSRSVYVQDAADTTLAHADDFSNSASAFLPKG